MASSIQVQSFRGVGSKRGYPYFAFGLYEARQRLDGVWTWRLVASGPWVRSDVAGKTAFEGVEINPFVRHGTRVDAETVARIEEAIRLGPDPNTPAGYR